MAFRAVEVLVSLLDNSEEAARVLEGLELEWAAPRVSRMTNITYRTYIRTSLTFLVYR